MHPPVLIFRMFTKATRLLGPWVLLLVCASLSDAAVRPRHHHGRTRTTRAARTGPELCSSGITLRTLARQSNTGGGPLAHRAGSRPGVLHPARPLLKRGALAPLDDDDAAIQNDAPVARSEGDENVRPALRPLGVLASSFYGLPTFDIFSPRSPRGPPSHV